MKEQPWLKLKAEPQVFMGRWALQPLDLGTWYGGRAPENHAKHFGIPYELAVIFDGHELAQLVYTPVRYLDSTDKTLQQYHKKNLKFLERKLLAFYRMRDAGKRVVVKLGEQKLAQLSNKQLAAAMLGIRKQVQRISIADIFCWLSEERWTVRLRDTLSLKHKLRPDSREFNAAMFTLTKAERPSTVLKERKAVTAAALKVKQNLSSVTAFAKSLARAFGWMPVFTFGDEWKLEHYEAELKTLSKRPLPELKAELAEMVLYTKHRNAGIKAMVARLGMSKADLQEFVDFGLALDGRNETSYFIGFSGRYLMAIYHEAARRLGVSIETVRLLYDHELASALRGELNAVTVAASRTGVHTGIGWIRGVKGMYEIPANVGTELLTYLQKNSSNVQGSDEARGTCASPGKATGKIRIVKSPTEQDKVEAGDILVTFATTVDYLPAMKRASAVVTEVGGLTCHAAVVSREFGIPCIVALKNAMSKLKDGDLVTVDADAGTVVPVT